MKALQNDAERIRKESEILTAENGLNSILEEVKLGKKTLSDIKDYIQTQVYACPQSIGLLCNKVAAAYPENPEFTPLDIYNFNIEAYDVMIARDIPESKLNKSRYESLMSNLFNNQEQ